MALYTPYYVGFMFSKTFGFTFDAFGPIFISIDLSTGIAKKHCALAEPYYRGRILMEDKFRTPDELKSILIAFGLDKDSLDDSNCEIGARFDYFAAKMLSDEK